MAKVYSYGYADSGWPAIIEDPRASNDGFYIYGKRHDKQSLTPQFNSTLNFSTGGGVSSSSYSTTASTNYFNKQHLMLTKMTVHEPPYYSSSMSYNYNIIDDTAWRYIDDTEFTQRGFMVLSDETGSQESLSMMGGSDSYNYYTHWNYMPTDETYLHETRPYYNNNIWQYYFIPTMYKNYAKDGYVYGLAQYWSTNSYFYPQYYQVAYGSGWPTSYSSSYSTSISGMSSYHAIQVVGRSTQDGEMILISNYCNTGSSTNRTYVNKMTRDGDSYATVTNIYDSGTSTITASGTHQGGNNRNGLRYWHTYSSHFDDPRTAGTKCFYKTWFDQYGDYHPFVITWDQSTDTFAQEEAISVTGDKSSVHANMLWTADSDNSAPTCTVTQTWVSNSTRYVGYFVLDHAQKHTADTAFKTFVMYEVDSADPTALTYHSKLEVTDTPRNMIWLNDERTLLGLFFRNNFKMYVWNDVSGWTEASVIGEQVHAMGRDSLDRIWYTTKTSTSTANFADINLLSPTLPVSVNITPELSSYAYGGSDIASYLDVSALNASGARTATNVRLVIEGSSMTFTDGSTTKTITTLTSGDLQVGTVVTGAGYTNVTASIEL